METEDKKSTKSLISKAIDEELLNVVNSSDKEQKIKHLEKALILKLCLGLCGLVDGGELKHLVCGFEKLRGDVSLSRSQEAIDDIVGEYREDFEGSGRC
ncbi:hypothetical protein [Wolbachia endosymbiont of Cimex lectularius]|uniref:hypothetical protein n=1 Tax=Wolbachia endosymbiont of Cimex lectularius TaxID=246273 RepID=UPI00049A1F54|nr:hypothetical protein [Wolbachia endosymbiont of Cimex lectularius]BAO99486.1 hypothetical protein WCLE_001690 [Wolbachia endosymbiont of Cimex lectularius]